MFTHLNITTGNHLQQVKLLQVVLQVQQVFRKSFSTTTNVAITNVTNADNWSCKYLQANGCTILENVCKLNLKMQVFKLTQQQLQTQQCIL